MLTQFKRMNKNSQLRFFLTTQNDFIKTMKSIKELENDFQIILQICQINAFLIIVETIQTNVPVDVKNIKKARKLEIEGGKNYDCQ